MKQSRTALRAALTEALANPNIQNYPEKDISAYPAPMPFMPWSKEKEMMESWANKTIVCIGHDCAKCKARDDAESLLQDVAAHIGVGGYNGATPKQLAERICAEFDRLDSKAHPTLKWCEQCGEGVTDFCRGKGVKCAYGFVPAGKAAP